MEIFDVYAQRYDEWYERNLELYEKELGLIEKPRGLSLEIGVGTGRFAAPLGIDVGIDTSINMLKIAKQRDIEVVRADAGLLPFKDETFESVYVIFTLCFLQDPLTALREAWRVMKRGAELYVCVIPYDSGLGKVYSRKDSPFYRVAKFYREKEVEKMLVDSGFTIRGVRRTKLKYSPNDFVCFLAEKANRERILDS